jgi:hypothetical protein
MRETMISFHDAATAYPTIIYTTLLVVVLFYWILALIGVVDIDSGGLDIDTDLQADASADDIGDIGNLASYLMALGLNGVPFSVVVTLITLTAWTLSCLAGMWLLPLVPTFLLQIGAGTLVLLISFAAALPVTARAIRPMRGLFVTHRAQSNTLLVGQTCVVLTGSVDEKFGRAEVSARGASLNIRVWAATPNQLSKGAQARIVEYDTAGERYLIVAEP